MPQSETTVVIETLDHAVNRLRRLDLTPEVLSRAVIEGESYRAATTEFHPKSNGGYSAWSNCVAMLRNQLIPGNTDWEARDPSCLPLVQNSSLGIRIAVTAGDENTGINGPVPPRTNNDKGAMIQEQVDVNRLLPFSAAEISQWASTDEEQLETWVLLVHSTFDLTDLEAPHIVYFELSKPLGLDADQHISRWGERILLAPINMDELPSADSEGEDEIEVPISRRSEA